MSMLELGNVGLTSFWDQSAHAVQCVHVLEKTERGIAESGALLPATCRLQTTSLQRAGWCWHLGSGFGSLAENGVIGMHATPDMTLTASVYHRQWM